MTFVSVEDVIDDIRLVTSTINNITNNNADPKKDANNVLKNDFITYEFKFT